MDWKEFVETLSLVEQTLRSDPADVYSEMDFATRDRYRQSVESIARHSRLSEAEVAQKAIQLADESAAAKGTRGSDRACRLLPDRQRPAFAGARGERAAGRGKRSSSEASTVFRSPFMWAGFVCSPSLATFAFMQQAQALEVQGWKLIFFTLIFLLVCSQLAVALMNWLSTLLVNPACSRAWIIPPASRRIAAPWWSFPPC